MKRTFNNIIMKLAVEVITKRIKVLERVECQFCTSEYLNAQREIGDLDVARATIAQYAGRY